MKRWFVILLSGMIWLSAGSSLLWKGLRFVIYSQVEPVQGTDLILHQKKAIFIICLAILIGFIKGRFVMIKAINRVVSRILSMEDPVSLRKVYSPAYLLLIGVMVLMGVLMNVLSIPHLYRGFIDVAIGSALIFGSLVFIRFSLLTKKLS